MHEKLNIIIIMRWYGISEGARAREERGENGKMEAKSFLCQAVASRHRCMWDIRAFQEKWADDAHVVPIAFLTAMDGAAPLFFFFYGSRCTTTRLPCQRSKKTNKKRTVLPCIDNRRINQWQLHRRHTHSQKSLKKPGQRIRKVARKTIKKKQKSLLRGSEIAFEICEEIEYPIKDSCHTQI